MMKPIKVVLKVALQNLLITLGWLLIAPFISMLINPLPWWGFGLIFIIVTGLYFLLLFFSNAELFKSIKNDYIWLLTTGLTTLFLFVIPSVMWVSHNNIYQVIKHALT